MGRFGLIGPSYTSQSVDANCQRTLNLYPEHDESGSGKSEYQLYNTPGLALFAISGSGLNRPNGTWNANGRAFCVVDQFLFEVLATGAMNNLGAVGNDLNAVYWANSQNQLVICSAGAMYLFQMDSNTFAGQVGTNLKITVSQVEYSDGFFFALKANSQTVYASDAEDATSWNALSFTTVSVFADNVVAMKVSQRELFLQSNTRSVAYTDAGNSPFPFAVNLASTSEIGITGPMASSRVDNSLFFLGQNERGSMIAYRMGGTGYNPLRISNFAVEQAWQKYAVTADVQTFSYQEAGHEFWVLNFPTQNVTWAYDVATQMWHERCYLNPQTGGEERILALSHMFAFGMHLVSDRTNGNIHAQSIRFVDDNGQAIKRLRRAPHISTEQYRLRHWQLQVDLEAGQSPQSNPFALGFYGNGPRPGPSPIGALGNLDIVVMAVMGDGSQRIGVITNAVNSAGTQVVIPLPAVYGIIGWRFYFSSTGSASTYVYSVTLVNFPTQYVYSPANGGSIGLSPSVLTPTNTALTFFTKTFNPSLIARWSDDGGHIWSNEHAMQIGSVGEYKYRAILWRLGAARDRVYEISSSDPILWKFIDGYLQADSGFRPTERLSAQLRKQA